MIGYIPEITSEMLDNCYINKILGSHKFINDTDLEEKKNYGR